MFYPTTKNYRQHFFENCYGQHSIYRERFWKTIFPSIRFTDSASGEKRFHRAINLQSVFEEKEFAQQPKIIDNIFGKKLFHPTINLQSPFEEKHLTQQPKITDNIFG